MTAERIAGWRARNGTSFMSFPRRNNSILLTQITHKHQAQPQWKTKGKPKATVRRRTRQDFILGNVFTSHMCELIVFGWPYDGLAQECVGTPANYSTHNATWVWALGMRIIVLKAHLLNLQIENFRSVISKSKVYGCEFDSIMFKRGKWLQEKCPFIVCTLYPHLYRL